MILSAVATDYCRPRQQNFFPSVAFLFNKDRESVGKASSFAGGGRAKTTSNLYFHQYIYTYDIYIYIYICRYFKIVHNNNETIKYYASCFKQQKIYGNYIAFCRMVFKYAFSFSVLKNRL